MTKKDKAYYDVIRMKASVLYINRGVSLKQISSQLNISETSLGKWKRAGKWDEHREDLQVLNEYKAAHMFIKERLTPSVIAMKLNLTVGEVNYWVLKNGWEAAQLVATAHNQVKEVLKSFQDYFNEQCPAYADLMELVLKKYIKRKMNKPG